MATLTCAICLLFALFIGQYTQTSCSALESYHTGDAQREVELDSESVFENTGEEWNRNIVSDNEDLIGKQSDLLSMVVENVHEKKNLVPLVSHGTENLALHKQTWQSSVDADFGGESSRAVDGNMSPLWEHNSCTHTAVSNNPWWAVDLGRSTHVTHVVLINRRELGNRLNNAIVGLTQTRPDVMRPALNNVHVCGYVPAEARAVINVVCASPSPPVRFVTVLLPGNYRLLTLCEVQVFGETGTDNLALHKKTWQSSVDAIYGGESSRAVDGNMSPLWDHNSCTHTAIGQNPWWAVDLGTSTHVTHVVLINRREGGDRLNNAIVGLTQLRPDAVPPTVNIMYMCGSVPAAGAVNNVTCASVYPPARFVTVLLLGSDKILTLCEVQVYGRTAN